MTEEGELKKRIQRVIEGNNDKLEEVSEAFLVIDSAKKDFDMALDDLIRNNAHLPIYAMIKKWFGDSS